MLIGGGAHGSVRGSVPWVGSGVSRGLVLAAWRLHARPGSFWRFYVSRRILSPESQVPVSGPGVIQAPGAILIGFDDTKN